jgi:hypothetical protein
MGAFKCSIVSDPSTTIILQFHASEKVKSMSNWLNEKIHCSLIIIVRRSSLILKVLPVLGGSNHSDLHCSGIAVCDIISQANDCEVKDGFVLYEVMQLRCKHSS